MNWIKDILADGSAPLELLIYFVVVVLWLINQAGQKKKRAARREKSAPASEGSPSEPFPDFEKEFRELFEGLQQDEEPEPQPARPQPLPPSRRAGQRRRDRMQIPPPTPSTAPVAAGDLTRRGDRMASLASVAEAPEMAMPDLGSGTKNLFTDAMHHAGFRMAFNSISMPGTRGALSFGSAAAARKGLLQKQDLQDRDGLRRGMAWRQILGPPKALETTPWPDS